MRILFVTKPHLPLFGGAQLTTHLLAEELGRRGHKITVLAQQRTNGTPHPPRDTSLGYLIIRSIDTERDIPQVLLEQAPDCVVVGGYHQEMASWTAGMLEAAWPLPSVLYAHDVGIAAGVRDLSVRAHRTAAVSGFVADHLAAHGVPAVVIRPIVDRFRYRVPTTRRVVLFVNPVAKKGLDVALSLAEARPDIPFAFVRCWYIAPGDLSVLWSRVKSLANVELRDSACDPAQLYGDARIVLMPSRYPEAWGRVAAEAVAAGIPVLGSAIGGIPDAVGASGILVDPCDSTDAWIRHLGALWDDPLTYARHIASAQSVAQTRSDVSAASVGTAFEMLLNDTTGAFA